MSKKIIIFLFLTLVLTLSSCSTSEQRRYDRLIQFNNEYKQLYPDGDFDSLCMLNNDTYHFNIITHEVKDDKEYYITSSLIGNLIEVGQMYYSSYFFYERNTIVKEFEKTTTKTEKIYFINNEMFFCEMNDNDFKISKLDKKLDYAMIEPSGLYLMWDEDYLLMQEITKKWEEQKIISVPKNADIINDNQLYIEKEGYDKNELLHISDETYQFNSDFQLDKIVVNAQKKTKNNELVYEAKYIISRYNHDFDFATPNKYDNEVRYFNSYIEIYDSYAYLFV